ncbi:MAG: response regulator [Isosphaeraceae bacterium]
MQGLGDMPLRILIVDDNTDTAESLAFLLQTSGHETRTAYTGEGAIEGATEFRPDAILLDVGLPDADGFEVARLLRANPEFRRTLLIGATGYGSDRARAIAAEVGFDHYLVKPFDLGRLDQILAMAASPRPMPN